VPLACGRIAEGRVATDAGTSSSFDAQPRIDAALGQRPDAAGSQSDACASGQCTVADGTVATTPDAREAPAVDGARRDSTVAADAERDAASAVGGRLNWAESFGVTGTTNPVAVALDPSSGDIALTGYDYGSVNFGGGVVEDGVGFLARFDEGGTYEWAKAFPGCALTPASVAVDGAGNVLLAGTFEGTEDFGGGPVSSTGAEGDLVVAEYDSAGSYRWLQQFSAAASTNGAVGLGVAALLQAVFDASGDVYVLGAPNGTPVDLGCGPIAAGNSEFVAELDPKGACVWSHAYGPYDYTTPDVAVPGQQSATEGMSIALDPTGNVLVAGGFLGAVDFGTGPMTAIGGGSISTVLVQKLRSDGVFLWAKTFASGEATSVGTDTNGNILMGGINASSLDGVFVQKLDPTGAPIWSKTFEGGNLGGLAVDGTGGLVITGSSASTLDLGGPGGGGGGPGGMFVARFSAAGTCEWAYAAGPLYSAGAYGQMIAASNSAVVVTGYFRGTLTLANDTLTSVGAGVDESNTYLASFSP
jgi:hypothetical protein